MIQVGTDRKFYQDSKFFYILALFFAVTKLCHYFLNDPRIMYLVNYLFALNYAFIFFSFSVLRIASDIYVAKTSIICCIFDSRIVELFVGIIFIIPPATRFIFVVIHFLQLLDQRCCLFIFWRSVRSILRVYLSSTNISLQVYDFTGYPESKDWKPFAIISNSTAHYDVDGIAFIPLNITVDELKSKI